MRWWKSGFLFSSSLAKVAELKNMMQEIWAFFLKELPDKSTFYTIDLKHTLVHLIRFFNSKLNKICS